MSLTIASVLFRIVLITGKEICVFHAEPEAR